MIWFAPAPLLKVIGDTLHLTKQQLWTSSITNDCTYCINSHTAAARKKGLDDEILAELNEIVALANAGNRLTSGLQVEVDEVVQTKHKYSKWKAPRTARTADSMAKSPAKAKTKSKAKSKTKPKAKARSKGRG